MHQRKAVSVLPVPVGARIRVESPRAIAGQPSRCGAVGRSKTARNQAAVRGWKSARAESLEVVDGSAFGWAVAAELAGLRARVRAAAGGGETRGLEGTRGMVDRMLPGYIRVAVRLGEMQEQRRGMERLDRKGGRS
jgi:hypothetical protein